MNNKPKKKAIPIEVPDCESIPREGLENSLNTFRRPKRVFQKHDKFPIRNHKPSPKNFDKQQKDPIFKGTFYQGRDSTFNGQKHIFFDDSKTSKNEKSSIFSDLQKTTYKSSPKLIYKLKPKNFEVESVDSDQETQPEVKLDVARACFLGERLTPLNGNCFIRLLKSRIELCLSTYRIFTVKKKMIKDIVLVRKKIQIVVFKNMLDDTFVEKRFKCEKCDCKKDVITFLLNGNLSLQQLIEVLHERGFKGITSTHETGIPDCEGLKKHSNSSKNSNKKISKLDNSQYIPSTNLAISFRNSSMSPKTAVRSKTPIKCDEKNQEFESELFEDSIKTETDTILKLVFPNKVKIKHKELEQSMTISNFDLFRIERNMCLNDNVIEAYIKYLLNILYKENNTLHTETHIFSTFFYELLSSNKDFENPYKKVNMFTSKIDLFSKKYIFIPINQNFHWFLLMIIFNHEDSENTEKGKLSSSISILDSLNEQGGIEAIKKIEKYMQHLYQQKHKTKEQIDFTIFYPKVPKQENFSDCGVYLLQYIEKFLSDPKKFNSYIINKTNSPEDWLNENNCMKGKRKEIHEVIEKLIK